MRAIRSVLTCVVAVAPAAAGGAVRLAAPVRFTTSISGPQAVALVDADRDARLDAAVVGGTVPGFFACYHGNGDGSFAGIIDQGALDRSSLDLVIGDFNGDGVPDAAAVNNACAG